MILERLIRAICLTTAALVLTVASAQAQSESITFASAKLTIRQAFSQIQSQTRYGMAFNGRLLDAEKQVSLSVTKLTLDEAMRQILEGSGFTYTFKRNVISITKSEAQPAPAHTVVMQRAVETGDAYQRNSTDVLGTEARRRQKPELKSDSVVVIRQIVTTSEPDYQFTSYDRPATFYAGNEGQLPMWALKTNLLYGFGTLTPNIGLEMGLSRKTSLELFGSYNPWSLSGSLESNKKLVHMILRAEYRYWLCERYNGHFFGADAIFGRYNIGGYDVPMMFDKQYRYDGIAIGGGITYGYHMPIGKQWGLEFSVGAGALWMKYDRYNCAACTRNGQPMTKTYFGPTNAAVSLVFLIK